MKYTNALQAKGGRCAVKYARLVVMGFVFCVLFSGTASAQCYFVYSANYAVYTSESYDGNNLFTSVLTDGSASMTIGGGNCGPGYQIMQNQINSATHTPSAYNVIGGTGGWGTGSSGCVNCYLSYQNNQSIAATPGTDYQFQEGGQVYCSVGGTIFSLPITVHTYSIRLSAYIFNGLSNGRCTWVPTCAGKCSTQYTTNTVNGICYTTGPFRQCFDILQDGVCWDYRTFCYGKPGPGICTN